MQILDMNSPLESLCVYKGKRFRSSTHQSYYVQEVFVSSRCTQPYPMVT
jgi:hypothetical protein